MNSLFVSKEMSAMIGGELLEDFLGEVDEN